MLIGHYQDYRVFLRDTLEDRAKANKSYSLRAFARDLGIAPQTLSGLLRNKKAISSDVAAHIAQRLNLEGDETTYFCDLVELIHARSEVARQVASIRLNRYVAPSQYQLVGQDVFRIISDWYHFAILELTFVRGFKSNPKWISKRLGISQHEASQALLRLKRLKLLKQTGQTLQKTNKSIRTTNDVPSDALKEFMRQLLQKAIESLSFQDVHTRDCTSMTMAIDPKRMVKAKQMIQEFRRNLCTYLENGDRTEVYCFAAQLFRLTEGEGKNA